MAGDLGAILLDGEFRDRESLKSLRSQIRLQGFDVFLEGFFRALTTQSQHGPLLLPHGTLGGLRSRAPAWLADSIDVMQSTPAAGPRALVTWDRLLLLSVGPEMLQYAWMRADAGRPDWPITAILHSPQPLPRIRYLFTNHLMGTLGRHDALVCPSQASRRVIQSCFDAVPAALRSTVDIPMQLPVIPMGVDMAAWQELGRVAARQMLELPEQGPILLWFGRLSPGDKGEMLPLLKTVLPVVARYQARLVIAGDDTSHHMAQTLRDLAAELGYAGVLSIYPDVSRLQKHELFRAADIFLALSDSMHEGFSLTIAEAMASGLPVVASDWAGHREWVSDGITGRLIPTYLIADAGRSLVDLYSGTTPEHRGELSTVVDLSVLSAALDQLLANPQMAACMGQQAVKFARTTFDWSVVIKQYDALWADQFARSVHVPKQTISFPSASFSSLFASYPTRFLRASDVFTIPKDAPGDEFLPALLGPLHFRQEIFKRVLQVCRAKQSGMRLDDLTESVKHSSTYAICIRDVEHHIGRLLKYGLLAINADSALVATDVLLPTHAQRACHEPT